MILNLFIGVITNSITDAKDELGEEKKQEDRDTIDTDLAQAAKAGKKIDLQFKQIEYSLSDIERNISACATLEKERRESSKIILTSASLQSMPNPPVKVLDDD